MYVGLHVQYRCIKFHKIRPLVGELFYTDGRPDRQT